MTSKEMRLKAKECLEKAQALQALIEAENRQPTEEEQATFEALVAEAEMWSRRGDVQARMEAQVDQLEEIDDPRQIARVPAYAIDHDEEARGGWRNFGEFAAAVYQACPQVQGPVDQRLSLLAAATGMQQAVGSQGGYLVPPSFATTIWDGLNRASNSLLAMTDNYTVTGESLTFVANAEVSRATGSRWGGMQGWWLAEAEEMQASKPTFRKVKIEPQQLGVFVYCTDKLLRNSTTALEQYLTRAATDEIAFLVGDAIVNGNGAGKPLGIMNSGSLISVAKESGQAAATIVAENIIKMWARLHPNSQGNAVWLINPSCVTQLWQMTVGVGTSGLPVYMPPGGLSTAPYATLVGRPVMPLEYCAALGTVGDIILADMGAYVTGTQGGVESASSIHLRFNFNESCFRFLFAVDGQSWVNASINPYKGSDSLSPFVALATRA